MKNNMKINTILEQLLFSTVRVEAGNSIGTGFLISQKINETGFQIFLVTNKHVVTKTDEEGNFISNYESGKFTFLKAKENEPYLGNIAPIVIPKFSENFFMHPNKEVDLAILNISSLITKDIFIRALPLELIVKDEEFDILDDIIFIGYPNGIWDERIFIPIIRKGSISTPFSLDYNGKKQFLIDAHIFPGSSGSPVLIKKSNIKNGVLTLGGTEKYYLAGIISKVYYHTKECIKKNSANKHK
jgi:ribosomal protein S11